MIGHGCRWGHMRRSDESHAALPAGVSNPRIRLLSRLAGLSALAAAIVIVTLLPVAGQTEQQQQPSPVVTAQNQQQPVQQTAAPVDVCRNLDDALVLIGKD